MKATVEAKLKRGQESWTYIYLTLGFALAIEGTMITMSPLQWPLNILAYIVIIAITTGLFLRSGRFQNKLIGFKISIEDTFREV